MKALIAFLLMGSFAWATPTAQGRRYAVLIMERKAGQLVVTERGPSQWEFSYEYNDRGRGPKTVTVESLDERGMPKSLVTTGVDYYKTVVDEHFDRKDAEVSWKNGAENAHRTIASGSDLFYVSLYGSPQELGLLARALLAEKTHTLPLLPTGEARLEEVGSLTLAKGAVTQYAISGLGLSSTPVWLDAAGNFFAAGNAWTVTIREGFETDASKLFQAQDEAMAKRSAARAQTLSHRPKSAWLIRDVNLFDSRKAQIVPHQSVLIRGNRIEKVGTKISAKEAEVIDGRGKTLLPGLWDMHVHLDDVDGLLNIASGVTSVRDMANDIDKLASMKRAYDTGIAIGPRIMMAGFIDGHGPFAAPTKVFADNEDEARAQVDRYAKLGYEQIKIYSSVKPSLVPVIAKAAHQHGMRVSGHIPAFMKAEDAVKDGYDEIQHVNFLFLNFFDVKDTRGPARFTEVAERGASLDLDSPEVRSFIELLKQHDVTIDPTLGVYEGLFVNRLGVMSPSFAQVADRLPPQLSRSFITGGLPIPEGKDQRYRDSFSQMVKMVGTFYRAGIRVVAGTDGICGLSLQRELELYVQAGIRPAEVLKLATLGAAELMKRGDRLGSIEPGKLADLLLVDGDPTKRIEDIRKPEIVIKDGVRFNVRELNRELNIR